MFKVGLEKAEDAEIKLPIFIRLRRKLESSRKISISAILTTLRPLIVWITRNCRKFLKKWEYQTILPVFWETWMQVKKPKLELVTEQLSGSKLEKEYNKAIYCHPAYLTYMQSTSWKCQAGWITSWNQDCWEEYQQPQIHRLYNSNDSKWRRTRESFDEGERGVWKS